MNTKNTILKNWDVLADVQAIKQVLTEIFNDPDNEEAITQMKIAKGVHNGEAN